MKKFLLKEPLRHALGKKQVQEIHALANVVLSRFLKKRKLKVV